MKVLFYLEMALVLVDLWFIFLKMGIEGWRGIIPGYNYYLLFERLYGSGWKVFKLLIPGYNIYLWIKLCIDIALEFNRTKGFGVGMALLSPVFFTILAFSGSQYRDGSYALKYVLDNKKKTCVTCSKLISEDAVFCPYCGSKYVAPVKRVCKSCGKELKENELFCGGCGTKYSDSVDNKCAGCGATLEEGVKFCSNCGQPV